MDDIVVFQHNKGLLKFSSGILSRMVKFSQTSIAAPEAGGILLGRLISGNHDVVIDDITMPMLGDQQNRFGFSRSARPHQSILDQKWIESQGTCNYLGEWHTHAECHPKPSKRDIRAWKLQCKKVFEEREALYFVIVGTKTFAVWKAYRKPFKIQQLNQI
ncbi:Mov34/MPN/PAD-1 family protein [Dyadobacter sp. 22481]|uniref:Mov34/MPN/PAD-1 family protein n=1 Tax=Dyadobacter sp. 22481 TaxID=3453926 RepID=UPI003F826577